MEITSRAIFSSERCFDREREMIADILLKLNSAIRTDEQISVRILSAFRSVLSSRRAENSTRKETLQNEKDRGETQILVVR